MFLRLRRGIHVQGPPAGDGGLQLVPRQERGHHLLCPQLLLPLRQPGRSASVFSQINNLIDFQISDLLVGNVM
jgi:hypothetical protein